MVNGQGRMETGMTYWAGGGPSSLGAGKLVEPYE